MPTIPEYGPPARALSTADQFAAWQDGVQIAATGADIIALTASGVQATFEALEAPLLVTLNAGVSAAAISAASAADSARRLTPFAVDVSGTVADRVIDVTASGFAFGEFYLKTFNHNVGGGTYRITIARTIDDSVAADVFEAGVLTGVQTIEVPASDGGSASFSVKADFGAPTPFFFTGTAATAPFDPEKIIVATPAFQAGVGYSLAANPQFVRDAALSAQRHAFASGGADSYLKSVFERVDLFGLKPGHLYRLSAFRATSAVLQILVRDTTENTVAANIEIDVPNYATLPEVLFFDPRKVGGNIAGEITSYTGIFGSVRLRRANIVLVNTYYTYSQAQAGLDLSTSMTRRQSEARFQDPGFEEVIKVAPGGSLTDAVQALWAEGPYSNPQDLSVRWCWRASPLHRIFVLLGAGDYTATNLYVPHWVYIGGQGRGVTRIKSRDSSIYRPNLQMHQSNKLLNLSVYADATRPAPYDPESFPLQKAQYGVHRDQNDEFMTPDSVGDLNYWAGFLAENVDFIGGPTHDFALFGCGSSGGSRDRFVNVRAWSENPGRTAPFFSSHTCITGAERASFEFENSWADTPPGVATVALQSEQPAAEQCDVVINGCPSFSLVAYSGAVTGGWEGYGDYRGPVHSTVSGDYLKFSTVARFTNTSGATIAPGTLCKSVGKNVAKAADGDLIDAVAIRATANNATGDFIVSRRVEAQVIGLGAGVSGPVYVANGVATLAQPVANVSVAIGRAKDGIVEFRSL